MLCIEASPKHTKASFLFNLGANVLSLRILGNLKSLMVIVVCLSSQRKTHSKTPEPGGFTHTLVRHTKCDGLAKHGGSILLPLGDTLNPYKTPKLVCK